MKSILRKMPRFVKRWWVPRGVYCYTYVEELRTPDGMPYHRTKVCPFWETTDLEFPDDALVEAGAVPGYCYYLGRSDLDLKWQVTEVMVRGKDGEYHKVRPDDWFDYGILWDQCKECGVRGD